MMNVTTSVSLLLGAAVLTGFAALFSVTEAHSGRPTMTDEQRQQMMDSRGGGYGMGSGMMGPGMMGPGMMGPGMMDPGMTGPGMMGPGMMGPGMMGPGMMGPGMMGPGMMGPGMMGPGMMGPGMMGPGMMGLGMMGPGMMGHMGPMWMLNLTAEQRAQIREIHDQQRTQRWSTMGKIMDESSQLQDLYAAEKWDPKAIGAVYGKIFDLKRQMIEASISAHNRWEAVLTQEQREQLDKWRWELFVGGGTGRRGLGPMHGGMMNQ